MREHSNWSENRQFAQHEDIPFITEVAESEMIVVITIEDGAVPKHQHKHIHAQSQVDSSEDH